MMAQRERKRTQHILWIKHWKYKYTGEIQAMWRLMSDLWILLWLPLFFPLKTDPDWSQTKQTHSHCTVGVCWWCWSLHGSLFHKTYYSTPDSFVAYKHNIRSFEKSARLLQKKGRNVIAVPCFCSCPFQKVPDTSRTVRNIGILPHDLQHSYKVPWANNQRITVLMKENDKQVKNIWNNLFVVENMCLSRFVTLNFAQTWLIIVLLAFLSCPHGYGGTKLYCTWLSLVRSTGCWPQHWLLICKIALIWLIRMTWWKCVAHVLKVGGAHMHHNRCFYIYTHVWPNMSSCWGSGSCRCHLWTHWQWKYSSQCYYRRSSRTYGCLISGRKKLPEKRELS